MYIAPAALMYAAAAAYQQQAKITYGKSYIPAVCQQLCSHAKRQGKTKCQTLCTF
jgi:hypothetical protein